MFLNRFCTANRNSMTRDEARLFFGEVFDLNYDSVKAGKIFRAIMNTLPNRGKEPISKNAIVEFFSKPGFRS